jgi:hypothetical protein
MPFNPYPVEWETNAKLAPSLVLPVFAFGVSLLMFWKADNGEV